jgi:DNA-binding Lrp family transcriptional regulator
MHRTLHAGRPAFREGFIAHGGASLNIYEDLQTAYRIIGYIAEILLREAKATGTSKGSALDARLLHELRTACQKLDAVIALPRKKRQGSSIARCSSICLDSCSQVLDAVRLDHPLYHESMFMSPGEPRVPADSELLIEAILLGVSTEGILSKKTGRSQPVVNRALRKLEGGSYLDRIDAPHSSRVGSREKVIIADGEGIKWCHINEIPVKVYRYKYQEGGHFHHLIANYFAYTTRQFQVVFTYYGFRHKLFPISSRCGGRCNIEPDLRGLWSDIYSKDVYLPVEVEISYKPEPFTEKVHKYQCSKEVRVILVTNDENLTEKYRRLLERVTPIRSKYISPTSFELYTIVPLSLKKKEEWSTLKPAGGVVVG